MATTLDSGPCSGCGTRNSTSATKCHSCGATLPWVPAPKVKAPKVVPRPEPRIEAAHAPRQRQTDGGPILQIAGGLIFCLGVFLFCGNVFGFFPTFPGVGYITGAIGAGIFRAGSSG